LQRDAEAEVTGTDKSGGFIGSLYVNKENVAGLLTREGLARVDEYNTTPELQEAEAAAKREKKNVSRASFTASMYDQCTIVGMLTLLNYV